MSVRVAAVDCGTNSLRLLIADVDPAAGRLVDVERSMEIVRLGHGVDRTGRFDPGALARTLDVAAGYAARVRAAGAEAVRFVATSATRDAADRDVFAAGITERFGVAPEVVSGDAEARLSFTGATRGLAGVDEATEVLVVDIGGGSTELVLGSRDAGVAAAVSVDIGCVRLHERYGPAGDAAVLADPGAAMTGDIRAALDGAAAQVPLHRAQVLVGLAGTVTTVTARALGLDRYDPDRIHGARLPVGRALAACTDLIGLSRQQRLDLPYMHPGRADVIGAGAAVWRSVLLRVAEVAGLEEVLTSEHDILDGIAWSLV